MLLICALQTETASAQKKETKRSFGLSAYLNSSSQPYIVIPIWVGPKLVFAPILSGKLVQDGDTEIGIGGLIRLYRNTARVRPYWGAKAKIFLTSPQIGNSFTDFLAGFFYGGEFFLNSKFSLGVEAQVYGAFPSDSSSRYGPLGKIVIFTQTGVMATIYF